MTRNVKTVLSVAIIAAGVALPLAVQHRLRARSQRMDETLRPLASQMRLLREENARLSNSLARMDASTVSRSELEELLKLRGEINHLREQTNSIRKLRTENERLQFRQTAAQSDQPSETELNAALGAEIVRAGKDIFPGLFEALQKYRADHNGERPGNFHALSRYLTVNGVRMPGLHTFEFARDGGPQPGDTLLLREDNSRLMPDGRRARIYVLNDGTVVERLSTDTNEEAWNKEHLTESEPAR